MRIAIVHDYFTQLGGAEQVASQIFNILPEADLFAAVALADSIPAGMKGASVRTSWMQRLPLMRRHYRQYFLLYPFGIEALDLSQYDLVVSSSSGYGKGVRAPRHAVHICYCHTPMRWAWNFEQYSERESMGKAKHAALSILVRALQRWDLSASREPDHFIANSKTVAKRILKTYGRHSEVIHPPIDVQRFTPTRDQGDYYLVLSRLVSYKRIDLAIEACNLAGKRLLIVGDGPDRARLQRLAGSTVTFAGRLSDSDVEYHAARCRALLFPGEEDFGMAPLEVASAGRPTIAFRAGGATETVVEGTTGLFFDRPTARSLAETIEEFECRSWPSAVLRRHAENFSIDTFERKFLSFLTRVGVQPSEKRKASQSEPSSVSEAAWAMAQDRAV